MPRDFILSPNKQDFVQLDQDYSSPLSTFELNTLTRHFRNKYNINLYVCETGQSLESLEKHPWLNIEIADNNILKIQEGLKEGEVAGYLHIVSIGMRHAEVFIITKKAIIKPIYWKVEEYKIVPAPHGTLVKAHYPQADGSSCGTLSLCYLKQLLKNDEQQFRERSVLVPYNGSYFFVPSPQVLQYSQSSNYNQALFDIVNGVKRKAGCIPLQTMVEETIANPSTVPLVKEEALALLTKLPAFIQGWTEEFIKMKARRAFMDSNSRNLYLVYTSERFKKIASEISWVKSSVWIKDLKEKIEQKIITPEQLALEALPHLEKIRDSRELGYSLNQLSKIINSDLLFSEIFKSDNICSLFRDKYNVSRYNRCIFLLSPKARLSLEAVILWWQRFNVTDAEQLNYLKKISTDTDGPKLLMDVATNPLRLDSMQNKKPFLLFLREYAKNLTLDEVVPLLLQYHSENLDSFKNALSNFLSFTETPKEKYSEFIFELLNNHNSFFSKKIIKFHGINGVLSMLKIFCNENHIEVYLQKHRHFY